MFGTCTPFQVIFEVQDSKGVVFVGSRPPDNLLVFGLVRRFLVMH